MVIDKFDLVEFKTTYAMGWNLVGKVIAIDPDIVHIEIRSDYGDIENFQIPHSDIVRIVC